MKALILLLLAFIAVNAYDVDAADVELYTVCSESGWNGEYRSWGLTNDPSVVETVY